MSVWTEIPNSTRSLPPGRYRYRAQITGAYSVGVANALSWAWKTKLGLQHAKDIEVRYSPPLASAHGGISPVWPFVVEFTVPAVDPIAPTQAGLDPRAVLAIAVAIVAGALALKLAGGTLEKLVDRVGDTVDAGVQTVRDIAKDVRDTAKDIFNPGTVILVVLAIALVTGAVALKRG